MIMQSPPKITSPMPTPSTRRTPFFARLGSLATHIPLLAWMGRCLAKAMMRQRAFQPARPTQVERRAGTTLQGRLDEIVRDVVDVFGYTGALIATYEQGDSLPVRAFYVDPTIATSEDIARWEANIARFSPHGTALSMGNPEVARVFVFRDDHQQNLGVRAARAGKPIVSDSLYDLFRPLAPWAAHPVVAVIQRALGVRQVIAVPFFLDVTTDGCSHKELVGNLFALKSSCIDANDTLVLSAFGRQAAASMLSERLRLQIEVAQELTYQMQTHLQDETQILKHIAEGVVTDLGYVACGVATYEADGSLPIRALYIDPHVASHEQIHRWEAELAQFRPADMPVSLVDTTRSRVFVHKAEYAENLSVRAAQLGRPATSDTLYDLFRPLAPRAAAPFVARIQQTLGVQQVIAVPFFLEGIADGLPIRELIGNLFAITRSQQFSTGEITLLQAFGQQAAAAIRNARLYQQSEDRRLAAQIFGKMAFSAAASAHALRNYVGVIRGNLQLLTMIQQFPAEEREDLLKEMSRPIFEHLERMVDALDNLHEPWQQPQEGLSQINICLMRAVKKAYGEAPGLTLDLDENLPEIVIAADTLTEAFTVLVRHALAMSEKRGLERRVIIRSVLLSDAIVVTIYDNGGGLPAELIDSIFEIRRRSEGAGMSFGMYWTKEYIEGIGGLLDVVNAPNDGTTFRASIPLARESVG